MKRKKGRVERGLKKRERREKNRKAKDKWLYVRKVYIYSGTATAGKEL